jgi:hypothetical protein
LGPAKPGRVHGGPPKISKTIQNLYEKMLEHQNILWKSANIRGNHVLGSYANIRKTIGKS